MGTRSWNYLEKPAPGILLSQQPRDQQGNIIDKPWDRVLEHGPLAIGKVAASVKDKALFSSPANRLLRFDTGDQSQAKNWLIQLGNNEIDGLILKSHAIPRDALQYLGDDADEFLKRRLNCLIELERSFMESKMVTPPLDREVRQSAIDTE